MSKLILLYFFLFNLKQECNCKIDTSYSYRVYEKVDIYPSFPEGYKEFVNFFIKNFEPKSKNIYESRLVFVLVIDSTGKIIEKSIFGKNRDKYSSNDIEGLRVIDKSPLWIPGRCNGKIVTVKLILPIYVKIE